MNPRISNGGADDLDQGPPFDKNTAVEPEEKRFSKLEPPLRRSRLWLALAVPLVSSFAAGSREPWALSLVAALIGLNIAITAPRSRISKTITWPFCIAMLLAVASLLPISASSLPEWRVRLTEDFGIQMAGLVSPQPWVTIEGGILLAVCLSWAWFCLGSGITDMERRWLVRWLCISMALLAGLAVAFSSYGTVVPHWIGSWGAQGFGPFPNRNHYGCYLAMGLVLTIAAGDDAFRHKKIWAVLFLLCVIPMFWALTKNTSRAAFTLAFAGLVTWMGFASLRNRSSRRLAISAAILLTMTALFALFGKTIIKRFEDTIKSSGGFLGDGRFEIFDSTIDMISRAPLLGVGLGNFEPVYALIRPPTERETRIVHPESDWLWLASETGLPAMLLVLVAVIAFVRCAGPWLGRDSSARKHGRLRTACAISALIVPAHGLVDVSGHNPGIAFTAIFLAGLSLRRDGRGPVFIPTSSTAFRVSSALFSLAAASAWLAISLGHPVLPGDSSAEMLRNRALKQSNCGDLAAARQSLTLALSMKPLLLEGYFDRASMALPLGLPPEDALTDFARARQLEPNSGNICHAEASLWLPYYPQYAIAAWRMAISRNHSRALGYYNWMCSQMQNHPVLREAARNLATEPRFKLQFLGYSEKEEFAETLNELLQLEPNLKTLSSEDRRNLFRLWYARGNRAELVMALERNASWYADGWTILATDHASKGDFKGACQMAIENLKVPPDVTANQNDDIEKLRREFLFHSTDYKYGFDLYEAEKANGSVSDALLTLEKITAIPNAPYKVFYEHALMLMQKGDYQKAWGKMSAYIEAHERAEKSRRS